jgi:hypothetical protein
LNVFDFNSHSKDCIALLILFCLKLWISCPTFNDFGSFVYIYFLPFLFYDGWFGTLLCIVLLLATSRQSAKWCVVGLSFVVLLLTIHAKRHKVVRRAVAMSHFRSAQIISQATERHRDNAPLGNAPFRVFR